MNSHHGTSIRGRNHFIEHEKYLISTYHHMSSRAAAPETIPLVLS
jgi:hypothetical protein